MRVEFKPNKKGYLIIGIMLVVAGAIAYKKRKTIKKLAMETINWIKEKTWDIHTNRRIETLHPVIKAKVKEFIIRAEKELGIKLRVTAALRTWNEQADIYAKGRDSNGNVIDMKKIVSWAKAGQSYHNYGLAFDVVEIKNGAALWKNPNWGKIGALGESIGFIWGGRWKGKKNDRPHFQMTFGKHHTELAQLYKSGKKEGEYVVLV